MSEWLLPAAVLLIAVGSTYVFCLRPMRNRGCAAHRSSGHGSSDLDHALHQARQELRRTREELGVEPSRHDADRHRSAASPTSSGAASSGESPHA